MTGQVKEDILSRFGELGIMVKDGQIVFQPHLLRREEFLTEASAFEYIDLQGAAQQLELPAHSLAFTYCQVPVVYELGGKAGVRIHLSDGQTIVSAALELEPSWSEELMSRSGKIMRIEVGLDQDAVLAAGSTVM
jgi:hypothetical protein